MQILPGDTDCWRPKRLVAAFPAPPQVLIPSSGHVMNLENAAGSRLPCFALLGPGGRGGRGEERSDVVMSFRAPEEGD